MDNINDVLGTLEKIAEIHKNNVLVPINMQVLTQVIEVLKNVKEPEKTIKTPAKRTRKSTK